MRTPLHCSVSGDLNDGTPFELRWINNDTGMVLGTQPACFSPATSILAGLSRTVTASDLNGASVIENASVGLKHSP